MLHHVSAHDCPAEGMTPLAALLEHAATHPHSTMLVADGATWTFARVAHESAVLARSFLRLGLRGGDRVVLHTLNRPETVVAYFACFRAGVIAVPLNTRYKAPEIAAVLARVRPRLYIGEMALYEPVWSLATDLLPLRARFLVDGLSGSAGARPWHDLFPTTGGEPEPTAAARSDETAVLLSTTGTTGTSKLVAVTLRAMGALASSGRDRGITEGAVLLGNLPLMHGSGLYVVLCSACFGASIVLLPRFDPAEALDAIERHRCTWFAGLPFMCDQLARAQQQRPRRLESLRACVAAGDACHGEMEERFERFIGRPLHSFWASSEDIGAMGCGREVGPVFGVRPGTEVRVVDEAGAEVPDGSPGEMLVRSPATAPGYWLGPGRIDPFAEGWFRSGDMVCRQRDGDLRFVGRKKELIVRGGSNISPMEVETALRRHPAVVDAAVAGIPDAEFGQRVGAALVIGDADHEGTPASVLEHARRDLADYKLPERMVVVEALPRNALGKVDRRMVADILCRSA